MPNYQNGKIYVIRSHQTEQVYIGSTTQSLAKRMYGHRNGKNKCSSYEIIKYTDNYIELIEEFPCNNKMELLRREGELVRATDNCVNKQIPGRTLKQYYQDNSENLNQRQKQYNRDNADKIKQHQKQNHDCDCGGKYTNTSKSVHLKSAKHQEFEAFMALTEEQVKMMLK
jgi:hypothetical protein